MPPNTKDANQTCPTSDTRLISPNIIWMCSKLHGKYRFVIIIRFCTNIVKTLQRSDCYHFNCVRIPTFNNTWLESEKSLVRWSLGQNIARVGESQSRPMSLGIHNYQQLKWREIDWCVVLERLLSDHKLDLLLVFGCEQLVLNSESIHSRVLRFCLGVVTARAAMSQIPDGRLHWLRHRGGRGLGPISQTVFLLIIQIFWKKVISSQK